MSETSKKAYFVTGGGTGGHIYPAMAVADALNVDSKVYYVGNKKNMEFELVSKKDYKFLHVSIKGMPRGLNPKFFVWGMKLVKAILRSVRYIKKYKPSAVFATGGYVSAPMIGEAPVSIECRVREVKELGSHDMFLADVIAVHADEAYMDKNNKFHLNDAGLLVYSHGEYLAGGRKVGTFGYSVKKKNGKKKR